jgi:hypothetical protein
MPGRKRDRHIPVLLRRGIRERRVLRTTSPVLALESGLLFSLYFGGKDRMVEAQGKLRFRVKVKRQS